MGKANLRIDRIGSDPEVFIKNDRGYVNAADYITGSKKSPRKISSVESIQVDNVLAEFNVAPSKTPEEMWASINFCLHTIETISGCTCHIVSSDIMPDSVLSSPKAWEFGCEPDFDGYGIGCKMPKRSKLRTAGGHIAVSFEDFDIEDNDIDFDRLARCFDEKVAKPLIEAGIETDVRRRKMYGRPGSFRVKDFGFEYRTLSNQWIKLYSSVELVFKLVHEAVEYYNAGGDVLKGTFELINGDSVEVENELKLEEI